MFKFEFDDRDLRQAREMLNRYPVKSYQELNAAIKKTVLTVQGESRVQAPIITGYLRKRIEIDKQPTKIRGEVVSRAIYGMAVHEGRGGRRGNPYMKRAVQKQSYQIVQFFRTAFNNIIKKR